MAHYRIRVTDDELEPFDDGSKAWAAVLYEVYADGEESDSIDVGMGETPREAVADLAWRED